MKIYIDSTVTSKGSSAMTLSEDFPKLLMPGGMCGSVKRCYVNSTEFIEYTLINDDQTVDEFMQEFAIFGKDVKQVDALKIRELILADDVQEQKVNYADKSDVAILTREVLKDDPHCDANGFRNSAFEKNLDLGFSRATLRHAIQLYA